LTLVSKHHTQGQPELLEEPLTKLLAQMASMDATANSQQHALAPSALVAHMSMLGTGGGGSGASSSDQQRPAAAFPHGVGATVIPRSCLEAA
jgi:hypothetical protein